MVALDNLLILNEEVNSFIWIETRERKAEIFRYRLMTCSSHVYIGNPKEEAALKNESEGQGANYKNNYITIIRKLKE